ncbi:nucleotide-binding protein [Bradyrhizobium barranii]
MAAQTPAIWGNAGMYVVTLVTQKGGSGKSTLTVGLAVAAMEDANRVAVIEADSQGTVSSWRQRRTNPYPRVDRVADRVEIERAIPRLRAEGVRLAIIDTAATNNNLSSCAISVADFCLIPGPSESGRYRSCAAHAYHHSQVQPPICFRPQPNAASRLSAERSCDGTQFARSTRAALHRPAQRLPGRARGGFGRHRICARRKGLRGNSRVVGLGFEATQQGGARSWINRGQGSLLMRARFVARSWSSRPLQ